MFKKATRKQARLRIGLLGPAGSGKTMSALRMAARLCPDGGRIAVIDTEHGSASLYADEPNQDGGTLDFDVVDLATKPGKFSVENYIEAIRNAAKAGYPVLVIDSLSHAWAGQGGLMEFKGEVEARQKGGNSWTAWREVTPKHNDLVDAILSYPGDVLVTMRVKMEHVQEEVNGRKVIRKVGLQPVQRDGLEYEFTVVLDIEADTHKAIVSKTRCSRIADRSWVKPGADLAGEIADWRDQGANWHDEDWGVNQGRFFAAMKDIGVTDYEEMTAFWQREFPTRAHLRPSQIGRDGRADLYRAMKRDAVPPQTDPASDGPEPGSREPGEEG